MTQPYPQQPGFPPGPPQYAAQQPVGYPQAPQQPQYAPQQPQYAQPAQGYAQPQYAPQQPQYGYQPQQVPAAPQLPTQAASLDGFFGQPSAGWGPAWQLGNAVQNGTSYIGIVAQWITKTHLEFATQKNPVTQVEEVRRFKNGDPVVNMKVPLNVVPDTRFTEGRAQFYVGPGEKDLLGAAIAAAGGDPTQPPPLGSMIRATKTGSRGNNFGGQSAVKSVEYWPPEVAQQFAQQLGIPYPDLSTPRPVDDSPKHALPEAPAPAPAPQAGPAVQQQAAPLQPVVQHAAGPELQQLPQGAPVGPPPGMPPAPAAAPQVAPVGPPAGPPAAPAAPSMGSVPNDPAKAELLARLTGGLPPQPAA